MANNKRMISLLMAALGSVSSSFAAKRGPNVGASRRGATQGRQMNARRPGGAGSNGYSGGRRTGPGHRNMVEKQFALNENENVKLPKKKNDSKGKWSKEEVAGVGIGGVGGVGLLAGGVGFAGYEYHYSDSQICKRNLSRSTKMTKDNSIGGTSFDKLLAYEMKCDMSGKASLKTRPFVWLKKGKNWYVVMRKDNKTVKGALKGLGDLFKKKENEIPLTGASSQKSQPLVEYTAEVEKGAVSKEVIENTVKVMVGKSVENVDSGKKVAKKEIKERIERELGKQQAAN